MEQCGTVRYGTVRYGTVRYGTVRYGADITVILCGNVLVNYYNFLTNEKKVLVDDRSCLKFRRNDAEYEKISKLQSQGTETAISYLMYSAYHSKVRHVRIAHHSVQEYTAYRHTGFFIIHFSSFYLT